MGNDIWQRFDEGKCYVILGCLCQKCVKNKETNNFLWIKQGKKGEKEKNIFTSMCMIISLLMFL